MKIKGAFPVRWAAQDGQPGTGVTIVQTTTRYAKSTSGTTSPTSGWQTSVPDVPDGQYLWTWVYVRYSDGTETNAYSVARMGIDGRGILSSSVTYSQQATSVDPTTITNWGAFPSTLTDGYWLYTKTHVVYSDNESTDSYSVSQVGVGSYYAGCQEYWAKGISDVTPPEGSPIAGTYVNGQTIPISGTWSQDRVQTTYDEPYLWNFEVSADSRGNRYVTQAICIGNFAKGIVSIVESYAISSYGSADSGRSYPSDIAAGDWKDEQNAAPPTESKRYQWNRTVVTYNDDSTDTHYHVSAVKGVDGKGAVYIDLDNENDSMLYDGQGTLVSGEVTSSIALYANGAKVVSPPTFSIKEKSSSVTASIDKDSNNMPIVKVSGITSNAGYVIVQCTYNGVNYTSRMTIKRLVGVDKYEIQLNHNAVSYNTTTGVLSNTDIAVEVYRTAQNGSRTKVTTMATYTLTAKLYPNGASTNSRSITFNSIGNGTASITAEEAAAWTNFAIVLFKNGSEVDRETIPINKAQNGGQGPGAIILDLDNENDSMLYDGANNKLSGNVTSQARLLDAGVDKTSDVTNWDLVDKTNVTGSINGSGLVTITAISATSGSAVAVATYGGQQYRAKITIKKLVGVDKFEIVCSPNALTYNTTKATNRQQAVNINVYRTGQNGARSLVASLSTYGLKLRYYWQVTQEGLWEGPTYITDGTEDGKYNSGADKTLYANMYYAYRYELLDSGNVILDVETVPISKTSDGEGKDAIMLDLDNENDSILYDGADHPVSDVVVSTGSLYKGPNKVTSGITWSIASVEGCTMMNSGAATSSSYSRSNYPTAAWISSNGLVKVNGLSASQGKVVVNAHYGDNNYQATLTLKKLRGVDKYELVLKPAALTYNSTTGLVNGASSATVVAEIWRTAQNGDRTLVDDFNGANQYGLSIAVTPDAGSLSGTTPKSYGLDFSVSSSLANTASNITVTLKKGTMTYDSETIPIAKTTNGSGSPGPAAKAIYRLSFAQPATPSGVSPQGMGALAWHDDPYVQDEVKITQQGDWYLDSDGFMRAPTIGRYERSVQILNFVTTADNQKIYLRVKCTTGSGSYVRIGVLDNVTPESNYQRSVSGSNQDTGDIEVNVPKAGVHFICIYYYRDYYNDSYVKFACGKMSVWQSNVKSYNSAGVITEWSTPFKVGSDSENTEVQTRANLLKQTAFLASMMDAWEVANGSTTEGLDGRNGYQVNHNTSSENIMDVLRQIIYDPNGDKQLLPDTWYTLSFWVKLRSYNSSYGTKLITYIYPMCDPSQQGDLCAVEVTAGRIVDGRAYGNTTPTDCNYVWDVTQQWVRHSITFKTRKNGIPSEKQAVLFRLPVSSNGIVICMPKLEQGTVATAYVTHDKDMADWAAEETGFPNDRGIWVESPSENYVWNDDHRDYVASAVSGEWKRYFVKKKGMTVPNGTGPTTGGNTYWEEGSRISTLLVNTIVGANASLTFLKSNRIYVANNDGNVFMGMGGAENGDDDFPLWIGATYDNRAKAAFRVTLAGKLFATNAEISGKIDAISGSIGGFDISNYEIRTKDNSYYEEGKRGIHLRPSGESQIGCLTTRHTSTSDSIYINGGLTVKKSVNVLGSLNLEGGFRVPSGSYSDSGATISEDVTIAVLHPSYNDQGFYLPRTYSGASSRFLFIINNSQYWALVQRMNVTGGGYHQLRWNGNNYDRVQIGPWTSIVLVYTNNVWMIMNINNNIKLSNY